MTEWPRALASALALSQAATLPMLVVSAADGETVCNAALLALLASHDEPRGLLGAKGPFSPLVREAARAALKGDAASYYGPVLDAEHEGGAAAPAADISFSPIFGASGRIAGAIGILHVDRRSHMLERRVQALVEVSETLRGIEDPAQIAAAASEILGQRLDADAVDYRLVEGDDTVSVGGWRSSAWPTGCQLVIDPGRWKDLRNGVTLPIRSEAPGRGKATSSLVVPVVRGGRLWALMSVASLGARNWADMEMRQIEDVAYRASDALRRAQSNLRLRESEARFRHMADSAPALIWMTDEVGAYVFANMHYDHVFGVEAGAMLGDGWSRFVHPEDVSRYRDGFTTALGTRSEFSCEVRVLSRGGIRWMQCQGVPRLDDAGRFLGYTGCNLDITEAKRAAEHRELLLHELNHRVKNTLATVQSIASQTLRSATDTDQAIRDLQSRIGALARVHNVLTAESWSGADLHEIVAEALEPYRGPGQDRFEIGGPRARFQPRMALAIAMALQELATNAIKYGALSTQTGLVRVDWAFEAIGAEKAAGLRMTWRETGGPRVSPPARRGFGTRLIERSLASELGGVVQIDFAPEGVVCTIHSPVGDETVSSSTSP